MKTILNNINKTKKTIISLLALSIGFLTFSQNSKTIFDNVGVNVKYKYENIGTVENPETSTVFSKYKFTFTIVNSTSKFYDISTSARFDVLKVSTTSQSDGNFVWNNGNCADLNFNYYTGPGKCTNYENDGRARLFVICPNGVSEMEGTFVYPQSFATNPPISWNNIYVNEVKSNSLNANSYSNSNQAIKNNPSQNVSKKITAKDLENAIDISFQDKIKMFKEFLAQNEYVTKHEGKGEYTGYGLVYRDFTIQFYYESDNEDNPYNTNGIGTSIVSMRFESQNTLNKVAKLLTNFSNSKDVDTGRKKISILGKL